MSLPTTLHYLEKPWDLETDPGVLAGVATAAGNSELRNRTYTEALVDLREGIAAKNPKFTPDMVEYHAQKIAKKGVQELRYIL